MVTRRVAEFDATGVAVIHLEHQAERSQGQSRLRLRGLRAGSLLTELAPWAQEDVTAP